MRTRSFDLKVFLVATVGAVGCSQVSRTPIIVPPEAVREWTYTSEGAAGPGRYVVRMTDGAQVWEVEFPDTAYGAEIKVPLKGGRRMKPSHDFEGETAADKEIAADKESGKPKSGGREDPYERVDEKTPKKPTKATPEKALPRGPKPSKLLAKQDITELVRTRNYTQALVKLVELQRYYPDDVELFVMKGSVYYTMGKLRLAVDAWNSALALDPDNEQAARWWRKANEELEQGKPTKPASPDNE